MVISLDIVFKNENRENYIKNEGVVYLLSSNQCGKTHILNVIKDGFLGKNKDFLVNNMSVNRADYNVIYYDDTTDFSGEFKFTKTNLFRELIYSKVLDNINETKLLKEVNDLFDRIDTRVNQFLEINVNKKQEEKINFDIEINDVNEIIDKFTNIYVDNYLIKDSNIPRSKRRKLIYNLLLFELKKSDVNYNVVFIDNFDLYLDYENTKKIISMLADYHKKYNNTYFFLTTSNNVYEFINDKASIYHIHNYYLTHIEKLDQIIEDCFMKVLYNNQKSEIEYEQFYLDNIDMYNVDVKNKIDEIMCLFQSDIGKLYISNKVRLVEKYNEKYDDIIIYCKDRFYQYFYEEIYNRLNEID